MDAMEQGVLYFRKQGASWHTAGEQAASKAIEFLEIDSASQDAFNLRAAFAATARGLNDRERGM
jgi:hypothetical protein